MSKRRPMEEPFEKRIKKEVSQSQAELAAFSKRNRQAVLDQQAKRAAEIEEQQRQKHALELAKKKAFPSYQVEGEP
jgi:hypothetical protein